MEKKQYTPWEKFQNWFDYNKWYLLVGAIVLYVAGSMLWNVLGIGQTKPDYSIAYVGSRQLPQDCVDALENALAQLGQDVNGDGRVKVQLVQYVSPQSADTENMMYAYATEMKILANITQGESYFFLVEDPDRFQQNFQVLAPLDGSIPGEEDLTGLDKVYSWQACPVLAGLELGSYTDAYLDLEESGDCQSLLQHLYLGRRFFHDPQDAANLDANEAFWASLTQGALTDSSIGG